MENHIFLYGKIHYKCPFSIAMLNYQRVSSMIISETTWPPNGRATLPCCPSGCGATHCTAPTGSGLLLLHQFRLVGPTQVGLPSSTSGPAVVTGAHHGRKIIMQFRHDFPIGKDWEWNILLTCIYMYL